MNHRRRSQVTMLMILGLVLFIIISLVLYLSKSAVKKQSQQSIKRVQESAIDTQQVKEFMAKCMEKLAKDAVLLAGRQGGKIYKSQGGTLIDYSDTDEGVFFIKYNSLNVAYNILPPRFSVAPYSSEAPDYPWQTFPYRTATSNSETFEGFFGINNIPSLNSSEGPNSIQAQIEAFIDNNIASCPDFSLFKSQGYDISIGHSETQVTIGSGDIGIKLSIPTKITNTITKESAELNELSTNLDIRLRDMYFFVKSLIEDDIKNIKFDISNQANEKDFFSIKLIKDEVNNDDLIIITDDKSLVYGKPFEYIFARRNRAPALYYIRKNILEYPHLYTINQGDLLKNSQLKAEDPDEDNFTFAITPQLPKVLNVPQINFRVEVSDGRLSDYQIVTVNRIE